ncbi:unnamed protein product [Cylindrotheca closterium]|uniref:Uncharacterized protein n=1 Tax=Cylindrotheca closterium TaxID=2856 RepID=A0AAD2FAY2_9STRA|nr:unnamed protein product [Cylindrotheca closterium]
MKLFKRSRNTNNINKAEHHQQQHHAARSKSAAPLHEKPRSEEYVYIPSRFGYDYAPPSLLAPSHSVDNSTVQHLSKMLYAEEPVSDISGNTASLSSSSQYKQGVGDVVREHQEYESKYQKTPQVSNRIQKPGGSKSHWRPSEQEQRQRLSEQQKRQRAEKLREISAPYGPPQGYYEERQQVPSHPYHHRSMSEESRQTVERVPTLRDVPSVDSGLQYIRERSQQSRYSMGDSIASSQRSNIQTRQQPQQGIPQQSVASSQRSQQRGRQTQQGIPQYSVTSSQQRSTIQRRQQIQGIPQQPVASSQRSQGIRQQPMQPPRTQGLASHSMDASTITTLPETFGQGTYYRQHQARASRASAGRPPMNDRHMSSYQPPQSDKVAASQTSARERKRNIERSYNDYLMRERGWVPTELVTADVVKTSNKKNKIVASKKLLRNQTAAPSEYLAPTNMVETSKEEKRAPIAPVVPESPKRKGFFKRLFGKGKSKKSLKTGKQAQAASSSKKKLPRMQVDPPSKGTIRGVNPAKGSTSASTGTMSRSTDIGSKTKMYSQPAARKSMENDTPLSMVAARSIASSHKKYGSHVGRDSKDAGIQYSASAQSKGSFNKQSLQQQQSAASSANRSTASNKIFFPETSSAGGRTSAAGSSRHPADVSTKFYSTSRTALQSQLSSHAGGNVGSGASTARSSNFDRRQIQSGSLGSSKRSNASSTSYSRAVTNSMLSSQYSQRSSGSRQSGQVSNSASQYGLQTRRSRDDWKPDPRMPDPWLKPRASNVIIRGRHRTSSSRPPYTEGRAVDALTSFLGFSCV